MKKQIFYNIRTVKASNVNQAIKEVENGNFTENNPLSDTVNNLESLLKECNKMNGYSKMYFDFLFSQLFMNHIENNKTEYQELEYDIIFTEVLRHKELYLKSNFNVDVRPEYDCICDYLLNNIQTI